MMFVGRNVRKGYLQSTRRSFRLGVSEEVVEDLPFHETRVCLCPMQTATVDVGSVLSKSLVNPSVR